MWRAARSRSPGWSCVLVNAPRSGESIDSDRFSVPPADALRVYAPGTQLSYSYEIYNAGAAVQAVASLWRGDREGHLAAARHPGAAGRWRPLCPPVGLKLADDLPAGTYVLQIAATSDDPKPAKKPAEPSSGSRSMSSEGYRGGRRQQALDC